MKKRVEFSKLARYFFMQLSYTATVFLYCVIFYIFSKSVSIALSKSRVLLLSILEASQGKTELKICRADQKEPLAIVEPFYSSSCCCESQALLWDAQLEFLKDARELAIIAREQAIFMSVSTVFIWIRVAALSRFRGCFGAALIQGRFLFFAVEIRVLLNYFMS